MVRHTIAVIKSSVDIPVLLYTPLFRSFAYRRPPSRSFATLGSTMSQLALRISLLSRSLVVLVSPYRSELDNRQVSCQSSSDAVLRRCRLLLGGLLVRLVLIAVLKGVSGA